MRKPKDRDFFLTDEGLLFCVVGYLHPPDTLTAYVKYAPLSAVPFPAMSGKERLRVWQRGDVNYARMLDRYSLDSVRNTLDFLQENFPHYVHYCPIRDMVFSMVSLDRVAEYYTPEIRLAEIIAAPQDSLEQEAAELTVQLAQAAGIPVTKFGVTGSLLARIHNPTFSDIDLTVYGADNAWQVRCFLRGLPHQPMHTSPGLCIRLQGPDEMAVRRKNILTIHPTLTSTTAQYLAERRWNSQRFGDRYFSVHTTRTEAEITEIYGDQIYHNRGIAHILARVVDVSEAMFSPSIYRIDRVRILSSSLPLNEEVEMEADNIREIISFDRIFADVVEAGAEIEVLGKLEQVTNVNNQDLFGGAYSRLVVGTSAIPDGGYLIPCNL
jgi:uncharacterized protein